MVSGEETNSVPPYATIATNATNGRSSSRSPKPRSKQERDSKAKERSRREPSSATSTPGAIRASSTSERKKRRSVADHNNKSGGRSSRPDTKSLSPRRSNLGETDSSTPTCDRRKERRSTRSSTPGAAPKDSSRRSSNDRKKERVSTRATNPGAVSDDAKSDREQRKRERASSSMPSGLPLTEGALLEATTVDANEDRKEEVEKMKREFEEKEKKRQEEFENKEKLRQREIKDLNTRLAMQQAEEVRRKEKRKKKKKRNMIIWFCCIIVLVGAGAGTFVALDQDNETTAIENIADPTSPPSDAPSNGPTAAQLFEPPNEDDCLAISRNQTITGTTDLDPIEFDMAFDVTLESGCDVSAQDLQILLNSIQTTVLPLLAGCPRHAVHRRGLVARSKQQKMIRGASALQRQLDIEGNRFVIADAFVTGSVDPNVVCDRTPDANHRMLVNVFLTLKGPVELSDIAFLIFDQVGNEGGHDNDSLKDALGLDDSFLKVRLVRIGDQDATTAAPASMPSTPSPTALVAGTSNPTRTPVLVLTSHRPSSSPTRVTPVPSTRPTLAPVSGPTPPPFVSPTARPSDSPSLQPSSFPTVPPTLAPVVGPTPPPTAPPSSSPSKPPTPGPTSVPSSSPSIQPTMAPSSIPSTQPTTVPSLEPSSNPSHSTTVFIPKCFESTPELEIEVNNWFGTPLQKTTVENTYGPVGDWCFGTGVTSMRFLFQSRSTFNEDISKWDVSYVTDTAGMFDGASSFNQDLSSWDVSSITTMFAMFRNASTFNQNLCPWGPRLPIPNPIVGEAFLGATSCGSQSDPISYGPQSVSPLCKEVCEAESVPIGPGMP